MSLAQIRSWALAGIDAPQVTVEVHLSNGLPGLSIVGLPEGAVRESRERVRSALLNSGFRVPDRRITINLAPADLPKSGSWYDLPIALGILVASDQLPSGPITKLSWIGELGLNGEIRSVSGAVPAALAAMAAGCPLGLPADNLTMLAPLGDSGAQGARHLLEIAAWARGEGDLLGPPVPVDEPDEAARSDAGDWSDIRGQLEARRALEVAVSGGHSVLMLGPPGCGKSMLAERVQTLMPALSLPAARTVMAVWSIAGRMRPPADFRQPPWLKAESSVSTAGLIGGGNPVRPGLLSLAHHGVLFLDEVTEFSRATLEALRAPLESGEVHIARARTQVVYPARPHMTIMAANPTPSGWWPGDPRCQDSPDRIRRYLGRLSGPLLDRIDVRLALQPVSLETLAELPAAESSAQVRQRVARAWARQQERQGCFNAQLEGRRLDTVVALTPAQRRWLAQSLERLGMSARSYTRVLRLARTLADMAGHDRVEDVHLQEALSLRRPLERMV